MTEIPFAVLGAAFLIFAVMCLAIQKRRAIHANEPEELLYHEVSILFRASIIGATLSFFVSYILTLF